MRSSTCCGFSPGTLDSQHCSSIAALTEHSVLSELVLVCVPVCTSVCALHGGSTQAIRCLDTWYSNGTVRPLHLQVRHSRWCY